MNNHLIYLLIVVAVLSGCERRSNKIEFVGKKYKIDNGWVFNTTDSIDISYFQGVDSTPGIIVIKRDSIGLDFDAGHEMSIPDNECSIGNDVKREKQRIADGHYKYLDKLDTLHHAIIDTINGKIATIIKPDKIGAGLTMIKILDCNSGNWISIYGTNITQKKEEAVMRIYNSLRLEADK